ncbi:Sentrin/sumo-specific protease senp7 [Operophtera brumata]|uniref:Sentrin/sumo-specific protease senp7 n=1 Tax=Operophtera brumata TaxID=104452 RepID=A0A0L7LC92_OPEBR|nr:Sentrin/sumo-specific protease senp7 [Operophtera brumata]
MENKDLLHLHYLKRVVNVPFSDDTHIQCMQNTSSEIDYFVSVGSTTRIEEMLENHPMLVAEISSRSSPIVMSQTQSMNSGPESPGQRSPPPRRVDGMLAVCKSCGYTGCRRVFTEEPKGVPVASKKAEQKKKETERIIIEKPNREEVNPTNMQGFATSFNCRTIRIGSYRYTPKEKVFISARGIKIVAPSLKNESRDMALQISLKEVVRILVHFGKGLPVIFLYTMIRTGQYIRNSLDMVEDSGPYYDPMSKVDPFKRITLLPETITEDCKVALKALFGKVMDELNSREANDILVRTCPKENNSNVTKMTTRSCSVSSGSGAKSSNPAEIRQILIYPPGKGGIPINTEDYMCLAQDQFLNDVIIDFYLKYLVHDVLTHSQRERTHIFSTFFYKRLTTKPCKVNKSSNPHEWDSALTPSQKRHARVKTWTKNVNIFEKDYIVVPINENCHWFVAIICFPSLEGCRKRRSSMLIGNTTITPMTKQEQLTLNCDSDNLSERDEAEADESDLDMQCDSDEEEEKVEVKVEVPVNIKRTEPIKQPCILIFDSLAGASRSRVVATLRDYLTCEYQAKQNNFTDCGLYLLQYVEQFFKDPVLDYAIPIKQLSNWFDEIVVTRKREEISNLLKTLMHKFNPDSHLALPDITFPTLNGKLIEPEEGNDDSSENEKGSSNKHKSDGKESEGHTLLLRQMPTGDIVVKRNYADNTETIHLRKTIRLSSDVESRSMLQIKQELFKKGDSENQILIPIKLHTSDIVKDIQNTLIVNKNNKTMVDKKHSLHNQNSSNINRQSVGDSDTSSFLKGRRVTKLEDVVNETSNKKIKRNEC